MVTDITGNLFTLYILYKWADNVKNQIKYQKFIPLTSERSSGDGDVKASATSEHKSGRNRGSKMSCAWSGSEEKGKQPMNLSLHLSGVDLGDEQREFWNFPLQFWGFWPWWHFTQTFIPSKWVKLKHSRAHILHYIRSSICSAHIISSSLELCEQGAAHSWNNLECSLWCKSRPGLTFASKLVRGCLNPTVPAPVFNAMCAPIWFWRKVF